MVAEKDKDTPFPKIYEAFSIEESNRDICVIMEREKVAEG